MAGKETKQHFKLISAVSIFFRKIANTGKKTEKEKSSKLTLLNILETEMLCFSASKWSWNASQWGRSTLNYTLPCCSTLSHGTHSSGAWCPHSPLWNRLPWWIAHPMMHQEELSQRKTDERYSPLRSLAHKKERSLNYNSQNIMHQ